jgi:broad specificity phosphatase PhoE
MRASFIRHGESTGNAGVPCNDLALLELTEKGWRQAREVAASWTAAPDLIVTSPYLRTQQTAQPTIERFPQVPVVVWPIQEFTYLEPSRWNGTLSAARRPHIDAYWRAADPEFCDGPGAESFATLLRRAEDALARLRELPDDRQVLVFSHGQFIHAVRMVVLYPGATDKQRMLHFWRADGMPAVENAELVELERTEASWQLGSSLYAESHS